MTRREGRSWRCPVARLLLAGALGSLTLPAASVAWPTADEGAGSIEPVRAPVERVVAPIQPLPRPEGDAIALGTDVLFDFGRSTITPGRGTALRRFAHRVLGGRTSGTLRIVGHTDGRGSATYNLALSRRRAAAVARAVREVLPAQIDVVIRGAGEAEPVAEERTATGDDDPAGRARNRRVELRLAAG